MINAEICLLKVLKYFKKTNFNNKRSIKYWQLNISAANK